MNNIFLGLGGNVGDVKQTMANSILLLQKQKIEIVKVSSLYSTPPWGLEQQPDFLNCCVHGKTNLTPQELLAVCQHIEKVGARTREIKWGPRTIDIDILFYENFTSDISQLQIPHPRISQRAFVLIPLNEIAPQLTLHGKKISQHANKIEKQGIEIADKNPNWWQV